MRLHCVEFFLSRLELSDGTNGVEFAGVIENVYISWVINPFQCLKSRKLMRELVKITANHFQLVEKFQGFARFFFENPISDLCAEFYR